MQFSVFRPWSSQLDTNPLLLAVKQTQSQSVDVRNFPFTHRTFLLSFLNLAVRMERQLFQSRTLRPYHSSVVPGGGGRCYGASLESVEFNIQPTGNFGKIKLYCLKMSQTKGWGGGGGCTLTAETSGFFFFFFCNCQPGFMCEHFISAGCVWGVPAKQCLPGMLATEMSFREKLLIKDIKILAASTDTQLHPPVIIHKCIYRNQIHLG